MPLSPSLRGSGLKCQHRHEAKGTGCVSLFTREWIEITRWMARAARTKVSLFTREWIEIGICSKTDFDHNMSPSLRGSGLKYACNLDGVVTVDESPSLRGSGLK